MTPLALASPSAFCWNGFAWCEHRWAAGAIVHTRRQAVEAAWADGHSLKAASTEVVAIFSPEQPFT